MVVFPAAIPVMVPVKVPIVAMAGLRLDHDPPPELPSEVVKPTHTDVTPEIAAGNELTITAAVIKQPVLLSV